MSNYPTDPTPNPIADTVELEAIVHELELDLDGTMRASFKHYICDELRRAYRLGLAHGKRKTLRRAAWNIDEMLDSIDADDTRPVRADGVRAIKFDMRTVTAGWRSLADELERGEGR